jgi:hypothetical protein
VTHIAAGYGPGDSPATTRYVPISIGCRTLLEAEMEQHCNLLLMIDLSSKSEMTATQACDATDETFIVNTVCTSRAQMKQITEHLTYIPVCPSRIRFVRALVPTISDVAGPNWSSPPTRHQAAWSLLFHDTSRGAPFQLLRLKIV